MTQGLIDSVVDSDAVATLERLRVFLRRFDELVSSSHWEEGPLSDRLFKRSGVVRGLRAGSRKVTVQTLARAFDDLAFLEREASGSSEGEAA